MIEPNRWGWRRILACALLLGSLWPIWVVTAWAMRMQPGKGPQGGEGVAILALMTWLYWQAIGIFQALRLRRHAIANRWQRTGVALAPLAAFVLTLNWDGPALPAGLLVALLAAAPQLWALWQVPVERR